MSWPTSKFKRKIRCRLYPKGVCRRNSTCLQTGKMKNLIQIHKAVKYHQCACRSTKVDGTCMFDEKCKTEAIIYNVQWVRTGHTYIRKSQGHFSKRMKQGHANLLVAFWNFRDEYNKNCQGKCTNCQTPKEEDQ